MTTATTLRLPEEYIEIHRETLEFLNIPGFAKECQNGLEEIKKRRRKDIN